MFQITEGQGFFLSFPNGWGISVQFGPGNYGDHYNDERSTRNDPGGPAHAAMSRGVYKSSRAEVAAIHKDGRWFNFEADTPGSSGCSVLGYQTTTEVLATIAKIAALP